MRPAVWLPTIQAGTGADVFTQRLCDALDAIGIRAEIAWLPHHAEFAPWLVKPSQAPDWANVVHVNSWLPRRFWCSGLPTVVTVHHLVHDPEFLPYRSWAQGGYHRLIIRPREFDAIRTANAVTTVSNYVAGTVSAFSGRKDITVIHNWTTDVFTPSSIHSEKQDATMDNPVRIFMAGSATRRKGFDLLPAFLRALGPGYEVRYAGVDAGAVSSLEGVVGLGRIPEADLVREYRTCDAVVSLSRYEGFGYTAAEAIACAKPFIGFRTSALPEVLGDRRGKLVPIDDVQALADAVREITGSNTSINAVPSFRSFSAARVEDYVKIYERLIGKEG